MRAAVIARHARAAESRMVMSGRGQIGASVLRRRCGPRCRTAAAAARRLGTPGGLPIGKVFRSALEMRTDPVRLRFELLAIPAASRTGARDLNPLATELDAPLYSGMRSAPNKPCNDFIACREHILYGCRGDRRSPRAVLVSSV